MRCYMLAVCQDSALDRDTNTWSLFKLVEQFQSPQFPVTGPLHTHAYFELDEDEINVDLEARLVFVGPGAEGGSTPGTFNSPSRRHRFRFIGFSIPSPGEYHISVEWRRLGDDEWERLDVQWPIVAERIGDDPADASTQAPSAL